MAKAPKQRRIVKVVYKKWQPLQNARLPDSAPNKELVEGQPGFVGIFRNNLYQVTMKEQDDPSFGTVTWLIIRRTDCEPIHDWRHLQLIKNQLCGPEREGIELYPAESRLVDESNQYHLFVLGEGVTMPFGYKKRMVGDKPNGKNKNRAFDDPPSDLNAHDRDELTTEAHPPYGE